MTNLETSLPRTLEIFDNAVLTWGLLACGFAQLSKLIFELLVNKRWRPSVLIETGGMPSSHSSLVTGTAAGIGWQLGFDDPGFALAATIAFIVMYDASGIRREAGNISKRVNLLPSKLWQDSFNNDLKENLGHSRLEVLVGSIIGPLIALPGLIFIGSPFHLAQILGLASG